MFVLLRGAPSRAQAVLKRENILRVVEQAEMPFAQRYRLRIESVYSKKRKWNEQYYEIFAPLDLARESQALSRVGAIGLARTRGGYIRVQ